MLVKEFGAYSVATKSGNCFTGSGYRVEKSDINGYPVVKRVTITETVSIDFGGTYDPKEYAAKISELQAMLESKGFEVKTGRKGLVIVGRN